MINKKTTWAHYVILFIILLISLALRSINISAIGYGNQYYSTTVYSMLSNEENFFFASFDPAGFVSVDKPPLGFWIQTLSAKIFGFYGWALMLPQILAGVLSCLLMFFLVRKFFGPNAGLLTALILAVTPIAVAADRNNTIDAQLVFVLLLSTMALFKAVEKGSLIWLLLASVGIGLGFNIKMLQAYMVLPAFYGMYFLFAKTGWGKRIFHLLLASVVIFILSFAWVFAVDFTPADERPYVGSSENNSVTELITGHNGLKRLGEISSWFGFETNLPRVNNPQDFQNQPQGQPGISTPYHLPQGENPPPAQGQSPYQNNLLSQDKPQTYQTPTGNRLSNETGEPGILRLLNPSLMGQVSWLLLTALFCVVLIPLTRKWKSPLSAQHQFSLFWGLWLIPMVLFFSFAGLFHRYYLEMLAPAVAALVGAGVIHFAELFQERRKIGWVFPVILALTLLFEVGMAIFYWPEFTRWTFLASLCLGGISLTGLIILRISDSFKRGFYYFFTILAVFSLLILPIQWAFTPVFGADTALPFAGPELMENNIRDEQFVASQDNLLAEYLIKNWSGELFLVAAERANTVAPLIMATGQAAMAFGGFTGSDPILTLDEFKEYIYSGQLRFVLAGDKNQANPQSTELLRWVSQTCTRVPAHLWSATNQSDLPKNREQSQVLFDCQGAQ